MKNPKKSAKTKPQNAMEMFLVFANLACQRISFSEEEFAKHCCSLAM
jgi:hypothetical protein